jgi:hypothetical protein
VKTAKWKKPLICRIGLHSYQSIAPPQQYTVEVACDRCGKRKIIAFNTVRERGGGPR